MLEIERRRQIVDRCFPLSEGRESKTVLDEGQNRRRVVAVVIDEAPTGERRDDQGRHPGARPPSIDHRRRDVIPESAVLVVGNDDGGVLPIRPIPNSVDQLLGMLLS